MVSVIIINFNTIQLTKNCINSVLNKTHGIDYEIILIDNASENRNFTELLSSTNKITFIQNETNTGFSKACNQGILIAKGDTILLLNNDVELIENSISVCSEYLDKNTNTIGVITCKLIYPNESIQYQCHRFPSLKLNLIEMFRLHLIMTSTVRSKLLLGNYFNHLESIESDWFWGTFFMFKKSHLTNLPDKKLNDDFFMYCEDIYWCYDFKKLKRKCFYLADTKVIHHLGQSTNEKTTKSNWIVNNEIAFLKKTKGKVYSKIYSLVRAMNLISSFKNLKANKSIAKLYLKTI